MKRIDPEDDEPAPFVRFKRHRQLVVVRDPQAPANSTCSGKRPFPSVDAVIKVLKHKPDVDGRRAYRCPICHQWHIGGTTLGKPKE